MAPLRRPDVSAVDGGSLWLVPYAVLAGFILLDGLPIDYQWLGRIELGLYFVPIFFIAISSSEHDFAPFGIILLGLVNDVLSEAPIGYWTFLFGLFYLLAMGQRSLLQEARLGAIWANFLVLCVATYLAGYFIGLLRADMAIGLGVYFSSAFVTSLFFPLLYIPLAWLETGTLSASLLRRDE